MKHLFQHKHDNILTYFRNSIVLFVVALMQVILVASPVAVHAACPSVNASYGVATRNFTIPADGSYRVWARMKASSSTNNSIWLKIDSACDVNFGDTAVSTSGWTWVNWTNGNTNSKLSQVLSKGTHTVRITGRESQVKVDKLIFTQSTSCIPTNTGSNCTGTDVPGNTGGGGNSSSGGGSTNVSINDEGLVTGIELGSEQSSDELLKTNGDLQISVPTTDGQGEPTRVEVYVHGKLIAINDGGNINVDTTTLRNGKYTLTIKAYYPNGEIKVYSRKIAVINKMGFWQKTWYIITEPYYWIRYKFE